MIYFILLNAIWIYLNKDNCGELLFTWCLSANKKYVSNLITTPFFVHEVIN